MQNINAVPIKSHQSGHDKIGVGTIYYLIGMSRILTVFEINRNNFRYQAAYINKPAAEKLHNLLLDFVNLITVNCNYDLKSFELRLLGDICVIKIKSSRILGFVAIHSVHVCYLLLIHFLMTVYI